ncbi:MAG: site-specific integrase [Methanocalculus sp.]|uniref:site-specific integrase n=1 Tax=Methanocalculus sp. TaxID=2004547 RepID=UPI0027255BBF|nr:site-specific integrase [Methanocalculus sp.]MDO9540405.1 site-specific integrase [Methanocalculus sp.]
MSSRFHVTAEKYETYGDASLGKAYQAGKITLEDEELIRTFVDEVEATAQTLSPSRKFKLVCMLTGSRQFLKTPFIDTSIEDLNAAIRDIKSSQEYAQNTKSDYVRFLKRFMLWMAETERSNIPEKRIKAIKNIPINAMTKTADDMLCEEDIRSIIDHCKTSRDRCFFMMLYEGGFRVGELGNLRWGQINFPKDKDWSMIINVSDKTGVPRMVPLVMSKPFMVQYMNDMKPSRGKNEYVFLTNRGQPLQYAGVTKALKLAAREAGVEKHVTPHLFRHSRITHMIADGMGESIVKAIMWGNQSTDMLKTYSHISNDTIMDAVAQRYGIKKPETREEKKLFEPTQCPDCGTVNPPGMKFCGICMNALTQEAKESLKVTHATVEETPEYRALLDVMREKVRKELMG